MQPIINTLLDPIVNFGKVTVLGGYPAGTDNIAVTLTVGSGSKLPNPADPAGSFNLVWFDNSTYSDPADDPNVEIVRCIANVNDTLTLMRAQEGTSGSAKNTPGKIYKMILAPINGTVSDGTLVRAIIDSTTPAVTQTNATGNYTMFDFADPYGTFISSIDIDPTSGTKAEFIEKCNDRKISVLSDAYYVNPWPTASLSFVVDFGSIQTSKSIFFAWLCTYRALDYSSPSASFNLFSSIDGSSYGSAIYSHTV